MFGLRLGLMFFETCLGIGLGYGLGVELVLGLRCLRLRLVRWFEAPSGSGVCSVSPRRLSVMKASWRCVGLSWIETLSEVWM